MDAWEEAVLLGETGGLVVGRCGEGMHRHVSAGKPRGTEGDGRRSGPGQACFVEKDGRVE